MRDRRQIAFDGRRYDVEIHQPVRQPPHAPRLVVVGFQPNATAREILRLCIDSILYFTASPIELWVVDNASPPEFSDWLSETASFNVLFNRTHPRRPDTIAGTLFGNKPDPAAASYANAIALELAARVIDPETQRFMSLHMDTMACHPRWLDSLIARFSPKCRASGVRLDTVRVRTLHILGMMFDFQLFEPLRLSFLPDLPNLDVGDRISVALERAGYELAACRNTHTDPSLIDVLPPDSPFAALNVDRTFNEAGDIIFMHLGRGIAKSRGQLLEGKTSPEAWIEFGRRYLRAANRLSR